jgi:hypothetical protein
MPRNYSEQFLLDLFNNSSDGIGIQLGKACVKANLPGSYVARALEVSSVTIYNWIRGKPVNPKYHKKIEAMLALIEFDTTRGMLPARSMLDAKQYIDSLTGAPTS